MPKICPLLKEECKKENCSWWSELEDCSIPLIADNLVMSSKTIA